MSANFVNLCRDFYMPLVIRDNLMDDRQEKCNLFLCLNFVPDDIALRGGEGGNSFRHLCKIGFLRATCLVIHFLPFLAATNKHGQRSIDLVSKNTN
jgi:hypothetical protein